VPDDATVDFDPEEIVRPIGDLFIPERSKTGVAADDVVAPAGDELAAPSWLLYVGQTLLAALGLLLVSIALASVFGAWDSSKPTTTVDRSTSNASAPTATNVTTDDKTVTAPTAPSDAIVTALLGSGLVLLIVGAFFPRITAINFPGGGGVTVAPRDHAALAAEFAAHVSKEMARAKPAQIRLAYLDATARFARLALSSGAGTTRRVGAGGAREIRLLGDGPSLAETRQLIARQAVAGALTDLRLD
jgi:hypothetical protein